MIILNKKRKCVSYLLVSMFSGLCASYSPVISHNNNYALFAGGVVAGSVVSGGLIYFLCIKKLNKKFFELIEENKVLNQSINEKKNEITTLGENLKNLQAEKQGFLKINANLEKKNKEQSVDIQAKEGLISQYKEQEIKLKNDLINCNKKVNEMDSEKLVLKAKITGMEQKIKEERKLLEIVQKNLHSLENQLLLLNQHKNKDALKSFVFVRCIEEQNNIMSTLQKNLTQKENDVHSLKVQLEEQQNDINKMALNLKKMKEVYEEKLKTGAENLQEVMKQCTQYENYFKENFKYVDNLISPFNENRDLSENAKLTSKIAELQKKLEDIDSYEQLKNALKQNVLQKLLKCESQQNALNQGCQKINTVKDGIAFLLRVQNLVDEEVITVLSFTTPFAGKNQKESAENFFRKNSHLCNFYVNTDEKINSLDENTKITKIPNLNVYVNTDEKINSLDENTKITKIPNLNVEEYYNYIYCQYKTIKQGVKLMKAAEKEQKADILYIKKIAYYKYRDLYNKRDLNLNEDLKLLADNIDKLDKRYNNKLDKILYTFLLCTICNNFHRDALNGDNVIQLKSYQEHFENLNKKINVKKYPKLKHLCNFFEKLSSTKKSNKAFKAFKDFLDEGNIKLNMDIQNNTNYEPSNEVMQLVMKYKGTYNVLTFINFVGQKVLQWKINNVEDEAIGLGIGFLEALEILDANVNPIDYDVLEGKSSVDKINFLQEWFKNNLKYVKSIIEGEVDFLSSYEEEEEEEEEEEAMKY